MSEKIQMEKKIKLLVGKRKHIRTLVTKEYNALPTKIRALNRSEKLRLITNLHGYEAEFKELNSSIAELKWDVDPDEGELESELSTCDEYKEKITEMLIIIEESLKGGVEVSEGGNLTGPNDGRKGQLKRPTAPLPLFQSLEGEDLNKFLKNFESTIDRYDYADYDKFLLLKQQVKGRSSTLLDSIEVDDQSYANAKKLLMTALASPLTQKYNAIKCLSELSLNYISDPFEYISKINQITETFKNLKIDINIVLQYFVWNGLNNTFKNQLISITNQCKPSLRDINEHFFEATERYLNAKKNFKEKNAQSGKPAFHKWSESKSQAASGLAADVSFKKSSSDQIRGFRPCILCSKNGEATHPINKCEVYVTAKAKIERLKILKACTKCGIQNHPGNECKFKFRYQCIHCKALHFSFLCPQPPEGVQSGGVAWNAQAPPIIKPDVNSDKKSKPANLKRNETVGAGVAIEINNLTCMSECILPTFTAELADGTVIRGMKDSGCQMNFVTQKIVNANKLKIIDNNFKVTINGFNTSKYYVTKLVELNLKFCDDWFTVRAVCIPELNTKLRLPDLNRVVKKFLESNYVLADKILESGQDMIEDINFVLGTDSAHCILEKAITFGVQTPSVFYESNIGVMLAGNIRGLINNLNYLPVNEQSISCLATGSGLLVDRKEDHGKVKVQQLAQFPDYSNLKSISLSNNFEVETNFFSNFLVLDQENKVIESELNRAVDATLNENYFRNLNYDTEVYEERYSEINNELVNYVLINTTRSEEGRLVMPLMWNPRVAHLLGTNRNLARSILLSNYNKLSKKPDLLKMVDDTFKEQAKSSVIERIEDLDEFLAENPCHSFLPHMGVFRLQKETTKCRVVFLSNLMEKSRSGSMTISHNQAMLPGPCINRKISTSVLLLRFDVKLIVFDICKAFLQILLNPIDQNRLLFMWFKDIKNNDFEIVGYKSLRLPFGLKCSPTILMLALYKILIIDAEKDEPKLKALKMSIYDTIYMDNASYSANNKLDLEWAYKNLNSIFGPYQIALQQFATNDSELQAKINADQSEETEQTVKLFGLYWNRVEDSLSPGKLSLEESANSKRLVLKTIASNYDIFNIAGPLLNRSRIFMHRLQCDTSLGWDSQLSSERLREWRNIAKQINAAPELKIDRFVGRRDGRYELLAFTDASKLIFGAVLYIKDLDTGQISFLLAKNRMVSKQLETKTIPSLELAAITVGVETLIDTYRELCLPPCINPINIVSLHLYSDSMVSLCWLNSAVIKLDKMNKKSVFVQNRIERIAKLCDIFPIKFSFVSGTENPADLISRAVSYRQIKRSCYYSGPKFLSQSKDPYQSQDEFFDLVIPNLAMYPERIGTDVVSNVAVTHSGSEWQPSENECLKNCSSLTRLLKIYSNVFKFISIVKLKVKLKKADNSSEFHPTECDSDWRARAMRYLISSEQQLHYPKIFEYFKLKNKTLKSLPNIVSQLNCYPDESGILRIKSKHANIGGTNSNKFPILMNKNSKLTKLIILDLHKTLSHAGCYTLLAELRKRFWVPQYFSAVKKVLRECLHCRRFNRRPVNLNQSPYRDFRSKPPEIPFRYIFVDHFGPYWVRFGDNKVKIWILCIACLWSRAINLKICRDLSVDSFLRSLQLHTFEHGTPEFCLSDLGSQLTAGASIIGDFIKDIESQNYLKENGIKTIKFEQYFKGCNKLGSLIESCVKLSKRLIFGAIRNLVLKYSDFEFLISRTIHLVNRRPIAFKEALRDDVVDVPDPITPEMLIRGYELVSINLIPNLQYDLDPTNEWTPKLDLSTPIRHGYEKLKEVHKRLNKIYQSEFLATLTQQALDKADRYKPVSHTPLKVGDIVLLKDEFLKPACYPLALVHSVQINDLDEVTGIVAKKGKTKELVKRHVSSVIPLLSKDEMAIKSSDLTSDILQPAPGSNLPPNPEKLKTGVKKRKRKAAIASQRATKRMLAF